MRRLEIPARFRRVLLPVLAILLLGGALWHWRSGASRETAASGSTSQRGGRVGAADRPAVVGTAKVRLGEINVYQSGLGTAIPRNLVTVQARVDGELTAVYFKEGQMVKQGDLLAQIDPRPYQVQLTQARGQLARDQALLTNAQLDYERYKTLLAQDSTSQQQLDTQAALVRQYRGSVEADQGQLDSATLSLRYARVTAPLTGRVGLRQVDPGNIVHATDANGIVTITQTQPMTVVFAVPETRIAQILARLHGSEPLIVEAWDRDNRNRIATGRLIAVDNQVDISTGTVKVRAEFPNLDNTLFANQFVNARALVEKRTGSTIIPSAAVQVGNEGSFVYVVQPDDTVKVQHITPGIVEGNQLAVDAGLAPGQVIVVDGLDRLREGSKVQIRAAAAAAPADGASPQRHLKAGHGKPPPGT